MKMHDLKDLDKDDVLAMLGLQTKPSAGGWLASTLGTFVAGAVVGAGVALLFAPKRGSELREDIRDKVRTAKEDLADSLPDLKKAVDQGRSQI